MWWGIHCIFDPSCKFGTGITTNLVGGGPCSLRDAEEGKEEDISDHSHVQISMIQDSFCDLYHRGGCYQPPPSDQSRRRWHFNIADPESTSKYQSIPTISHAMSSNLLRKRNSPIRSLSSEWDGWYVGKLPMCYFITPLDDKHFWECDGFGGRGILLLLFKCEEVVPGDDAPSSGWVEGYLRHVLSMRDSFSRKPSKSMFFISSLKSFSLMAIDYKMGNSTCCDDKLIGGELGRGKKENNNDKVESGVLSGGGVTGKQLSQKKKEDIVQVRLDPTHVESKEAAIVEHNFPPSIEIPQLLTQVQTTLSTENFFPQLLQLQCKNVLFQQDYYFGQLDESSNRPNGLGKLYKSEGSVYIGQFHMGKAQGRGAFIFPDGSYYHGQFVNNFAQGQGKYKSQEFAYTGHFKGNLFDGQGKEKGPAHSFNGEYERGRKKEGLLIWKVGEQEYEYFGQFASNQFEGTGTLKQPKGTYKGEFIKGQKHGRGRYSFLNGLTYQGEYRYGMRSGNGKLLNSNNSVAYEGEFYKGLPHGQGSIPGKDGGERVKGRWVEGIDVDSL